MSRGGCGTASVAEDVSESADGFRVEAVWAAMVREPPRMILIPPSSTSPAVGSRIGWGSVSSRTVEAEWYGMPSQLTLSDFELLVFLATLRLVLEDLVLEDLVLEDLALADLLLADLLLAFAFAELFLLPSSSENNGLMTLKPACSELSLLGLLAVLDLLAVLPEVRDFCAPLLEPLFLATELESLRNKTSSRPFGSVLAMFSCWWFASPLGFEPDRT